MGLGDRMGLSRQRRHRLGTGLLLAAGVVVCAYLVALSDSTWLRVAGVCGAIACGVAAHVVYAPRGRREPEAFGGGVLLPRRPGYAAELFSICLFGAAGGGIVGVVSLLAEAGDRRAGALVICAPGLLVLATFMAVAIVRRRGGLLLTPEGLTSFPLLSRSRTVLWRDIFEVESDPLWDGWIGLHLRGDEEIKIGITAVALPADEVIGLVSRYATTPADRAELASLERFTST
jgi:hypothetical protein